MSAKNLFQNPAVKLTLFAIAALGVFAMAWFAGEAFVPAEIVEQFQHQLEPGH